RTPGGCLATGAGAADSGAACKTRRAHGHDQENTVTRNNPPFPPIAIGVVSLLLSSLTLMPGRAGAQQPLPAERPQIRGPLSVEKAVQTGLRETLMIRAAQTDVRAAAADTRVAQSMTLPQISANTYLTHGDTSNIVGTSPNVTPTNQFAVPSRPFA